VIVKSFLSGGGCFTIGLVSYFSSLRRFDILTFVTLRLVACEYCLESVAWLHQPASFLTAS